MPVRPPVPADLRRQVLLEAGHRCASAIHTCRHVDVDVHHIVPWAKVQEHTFENLIALCPNCHRRAEKGVPGWRETYDIEAKAPANAVPAGFPEGEKRRRVQGMIRGLLADRFELVIRVEQKTMPVYALTVASGGPNLRKSTIAERNCIFDTGTPESCHTFIPGRGHPLNATAITMDDLAQYIENWTDVPVVNRTAVSGLFAVETEGWTPMRLPPPPPGNPPAVRLDNLPTIFTVLRTLGLELKRARSHSAGIHRGAHRAPVRRMRMTHVKWR